MARMRGPRFKKCRSLGLNVCGHPKAMNRETSDRSRRKMSSYGIQLQEKQRLRGYYEVMEKQFKRYVIKAIESREISGVALVQTLERRLDNITYRLNFGSSIRQARQLVGHGHIRVNGKKIDIPSYIVQVGDVISLSEKAIDMELFKNNFIDNVSFEYPYLLKDEKSFSGTLIRLPARSEVPIQIDDHLVIEYYSKLM